MKYLAYIATIILFGIILFKGITVYAENHKPTVVKQSLTQAQIIRDCQYLQSLQK